MTWRDNYKLMTAEQLSVEYQRLLVGNKKRHITDLGDKLNFLKNEFKIKIRCGG